MEVAQKLELVVQFTYMMMMYYDNKYDKPFQ